MRRKPGALVPLEVSILDLALDLRRSGIAEFHGFLMVKILKARPGEKQLTAQGTLYRALDRLAKFEFVSRRWEDQLVAQNEQRPPRRLYQITGQGEAALAEARKRQIVEATSLTVEPAPL